MLDHQEYDRGKWNEGRVWYSENGSEHPEFVSLSLRKPENEDDYDALVLAVDELLEMTGDDESHPLMSLVDIIGDWIEEWDHTITPCQASGVRFSVT